MSSTVPIIINEKNLSYAWCRVLLHIIDNPGKEISPLVISLTGFNQGITNEDQSIRDALDNCLKDRDQSIDTVANTIFPSSIWRHSKYDRKKFFEAYIKNLPRIKALNSKNKRGIYFERLISFGSGPHNGNQLEHIIYEYKSHPKIRRNMFQASIFDPGRDHIPDLWQLGFPCLQHISFVPNNKDETLIINAFYATQQLINKAYGNYLGLCRLGHFMAHEMGLKFDRMNCFIGVEKLEKIGKETIGKKSPTLAPVIDASRKTISQWQT